MALRGRKSLGIALGSRSLQVAEVHAAGGVFQFVRAAEFKFGDDDSLQDPVALGKKLSQFLKQQEFSAHQAVAGLPAQWMMLKEKALPPAPPEAMASMLLIQAERDFSLEPSALALDYIPSRTAGQEVVLVAALRERLVQVQTLAKSAGLKLLSVTGTTLALSEAAQHDNVFYFGSNGAELVTRGKDQLPRLRHISSSTVASKSSAYPAAAQLAGELRRGIALSQRSNESAQMMYFDDIGVESDVVNDLSAEMKTPLTHGERFKNLNVKGFAPAHAAGSTALALCSFQPALAPVDFLNSRLTVRPPPKINSRVIWGTVAGIVLALGAGYMLLDWQQSAAEVASLREQRDDMKENLEKAKDFISRVNATRTWYESRPNYLECLRAITLCFPEEGRVWTTSVSLREDMRGMLSGLATDERHVLEVLDKLKASPSFSGVKMLQMRGAGAKNSEISFGVSFVFTGGK